MKNAVRTVSGAVLVLAFVALLCLGTVGVSAQTPLNTPTPGVSPNSSGTPNPAQAPPAAASTNTDDPARAVAFGSAIQRVAPGTAEWLKFDYTSQTATLPRPTVTITLLNGVTNGLQFEVYAPEQIQNVWYNNPPTGRGTQQVLIDCNNPSDSSGHCATNDLVWNGGFGLDGPIYVRIINNGSANVAPQLIVTGSGLAACQRPNPPAAANPPGGADQPFAQIQCTSPTQNPAAPVAGG